ncbi:MAG: aldehyde dehydrogenase family protein, partial [Proteobacteria bacterium]|nr:aldehyde dehydrogenase family protein [Pseudomonadota bacterium]
MAFEKPTFKNRYENFIGGEFVAPVKGQYFENTSPVDGQVMCEMPRSTAEDIEAAIDAGEKAFETWGSSSVTERSMMMLKIADRIETNLEMLAAVETWDNGKSVREC